MQVAELETTLMELAAAFAGKGPGYAQQGVVLREVHQRVQPKTIKEEQRILDAWHRLFAEGRLAWGYDLDNPGPPFFHIPSDN